jgi:23S rRNA (adenine2503-C2)-methyltransferase
MGMGEPMLNLDEVIRSIQRLGEPTTAGLGHRHITVSTVGIVPGIERLAASGLGVHLALSLHAPDDATRGRLVPMNRKYKVAEIIAAARAYQDRTGEIVTIEYCVLADVNDSDEQAAELAQLLTGFRAHVNLIPYNWIGSGLSGVIYRRPSPQRLERFLGILRDAHTVAHFRKTRGDDVAAACGQLAILRT